MNRTLIACGALLVATLSFPAAAQLKSPSDKPGKPATAAPAAAAATASAPAPKADANANEEKEKAGQLAAAGWLTLLDRRDWGTAWETSAATFRNAVPLASWMDGAPKARADFGALQERAPGVVAYKDRIDRMPPGEYVTVVFVSKFAQRGDVEETVTTVREPDGRWRVMGYSTR